MLKYRYWIPLVMLIFATIGWILSSLSSLEVIILVMGLFIWDAIYDCADSLRLIHKMKFEEKYPEESEDYNED